MQSVHCLTPESASTGPQSMPVPRRFLFCLLAAIPLGSCTSTDTPPPVEVSAAPTNVPVERTARDILSDLDRTIDGSDKFSDLTRDVQAILAATLHESEGRIADAVREWHLALATAEGRFGKAAFEGWVRAYTRQLGKKTDPAVLARLLLVETRGGTWSPWMVSNQYVSELVLAQALQDIVPEWIDTSQSGSKTTSLPSPPEKPGVPSDDPLLTQTSQRWCPVAKQGSGPQFEAWMKWSQTLSADLQRWWKTLSTECIPDQTNEVVAQYKNHHEFFSKNAETTPFALEAVSRLIKLKRASGERETVSDDYLTLMNTWNLRGITEKAMGLESAKFAIRRIDDTLWAARYRILIGDIETAKSLAQAAIDLIATTWASQPSLSSASRDELTNLRAEAFHFLAFRVSVETGKFDSAAALNELALQTPGLSQEWRDRLNWFAGFYEYMGRNWESARRKWEAMIVESPDEGMRATLYFWLSRTYAALGQAAESEFYLRTLTDDYPLSWYSVVAAGEVGWDKGAWTKKFPDPQQLVAKLGERRDWKLDKIRKNGRVGRLLARAELLVSAKAGIWAKYAVQELEDAMQRSFAMETNNSAWIYLSRLHYAAGNWNNAIVITTQLSSVVSQFWTKWPEQLLVTFPRPFSDAYARTSSETGVSREIMLALSRQESGFRADARSPASAFGVMQLIRRTALRFASNSESLTQSELELRLLDPTTNISIGGRYLKTLSDHFRGNWPATWAAYNAGEYSVDGWIARRPGGSAIEFVELIPFGETKSYVRNVWRNLIVYQYLSAAVSPIADAFAVPLDLRAEVPAALGSRDLASSNF
jgi:soluble lytic murein transglycosylase-like protein